MFFPLNIWILKGSIQWNGLENSWLYYDWIEPFQWNIGNWYPFFLLTKIEIENRKYKYIAKWIRVNVTCCLCSKCQRIISDYESDIETRLKSMETRLKSMETTKHKQQPWKNNNIKQERSSRTQHALAIAIATATAIANMVKCQCDTGFTYNHISNYNWGSCKRSHTVIDWF